MTDEHDKTLAAFHESLVKWADVTKSDSLKNLSKGFLVGTLGTVQTVEAFCSWLLVGTGATAALIIANLNTLQHSYLTGDLRCLLFLLVLSALFGLLARVAAIRVRIFLDTERSIRECYLQVSAQHDAKVKEIQGMAEPHGFEIDGSVDFSPVILELERAFPWYVRRAARRGFEQGVMDYLHGHIQATRAYFRMSIYLMFQLVFAIAFVVYAATTLRLSN